MAKDNGAAEDDVDGKTGRGAPGDDSKGSKDGNADDGEFVPKTQFLAALKSANEKYDALVGQFDAFKAGQKADGPEKKADAPKVYTRAELKAAVEASQISQDHADDIWARQVQNVATENATRAALDAVERKSQQERIETDLAQYKRLVPDLLDRTSDTFAKVREEFQDLVKNGSPNSLTTERTAIRAVLGSLEKLQAAKAAARSAEHHEESGAGGEGGQRKKGTGKLVDTLSDREKKYYASLIEKGHHKDWKEVEELLTKHARPEVRRRAGARV